MKTVGDLLRSADPVRHEAPWSLVERLAVRRRVMAADQHARIRPSRRSLMVGVATFCVALTAGIIVGPRLLSPILAAAVRLEIRLAEELPRPGLEARIVSEGRTIYLHREPVVTNEDVAEARVVPGATPSAFGIEITFTALGGERMSRATKAHLGKLVAILIDGQVVTLPRLLAPIGTFAVIDADYTRSEAERIVEGMSGR
jgi:hypothetical protein